MRHITNSAPTAVRPAPILTIEGRPMIANVQNRGTSTKATPISIRTLRRVTAAYPSTSPRNWASVIACTSGMGMRPGVRPGF